MRKDMTDPEWESQEDRNVDLALQHLMHGEAPEELHCAARQQFECVRAQLSQNKAPLRGRVSTWAFRLIPLMAAIIILVAGWFLFVRSQEITWAEVRTNFREVPFFSASIYITHDYAKPAERVELWKARDGRLRLHQGGVVFLADKGKLLSVWDVIRKKTIDVKSLDDSQRRTLHMDEALQLVDLFADIKVFSIDTLLAHFSGKHIISPPLQNTEAANSQDIEVFDVTNNSTPEWMRVWVMKNAGLPMRFRLWDPRDGQCTEMLFDYMSEQPAEAFEPDAVSKAILEHQNAIYALLREPGKQLLTPEDLFKKKGYHMPELIEAGRTDDGLVWIKSIKGENRTPKGVTFYGFGRITDDLGQEYLRRYSTQGDSVIESFIPLDYSDSYRKPSQYMLTCCSQSDVREEDGDVVGSIALTEWKEGASLPEPLGTGSQTQDALKIVIDEWTARENWDHVDRLLAKIPGDPKDNELAFYREETRLKKWSLMDRDDEVMVLGKSLHEILDQRPPAEAILHPSVVEEYVTRLVKHNQREEAQRVLSGYRDVFQSSKDMSLASSVFLNLVRQCRDTGYNQGQIDALFGFTVWQLPRVQDYLKMFPQSGVTVDEDPRFDSWRAYVHDVAKYYEGHALPQSVDFPAVSPFDSNKCAYDMPLPGVKGYRIALLGGTWKELVQSFARSQKEDPELVQVVPELQEKRAEGTVVFPESVRYEGACRAFFEKNGVHVETRQIDRTVWVARYDGRPLPCWLYVHPLTADDLGSEPVLRGGGRTMTASTILNIFQMAINQGNLKEKVIIVDETGLPSALGKNQSWGSICLSNQYAFGIGDAATERAKEWFKDNFGITFSKEMRIFPASTLVPNK